MSIVKNPTLFSQYFDISSDVLAEAGLLDPFIDVDTPLFIDPILLDKSSNKIIKEEAFFEFKSHFEKFVRLLIISKQEGDAAWRAAQRLLNLREPAENGLGYGGSGRSGSSRPNDVRDSIMRTAKEIVDLGFHDPEMISLMGFFEEKVGPDTISDFTTRVIHEQLMNITQVFCSNNRIAVKKIDAGDKFALPHFRHSSGREAAIMLVPVDIVRPLPVANDWSEIEAAASASAQIRERVNIFLAGITHPTVSDRKDALKRAALGSSELMEALLASIKDIASHYDKNKDALGYFALRSILQSDRESFKTEKNYDLSTGPDSILKLVLETIDMFKHHVENGNLWEELWLGDSPKRERAAQLIYYAIADVFCMANNVDISPEANMGGGPIDFKFSKGYNARVLVEMKRSMGTVRHGYERQLEIYRDASRTNYGVFVVLDFGDLGLKLQQINAIRAQRLAEGERASDIVVIDATKKDSASKRE